MAQASVTANFDQPLDVQLHFTAEIALHLVILHDVITQEANFGVCQILHPGIRTDPGISEDSPGSGWADTVNVG